MKHFDFTGIVPAQYTGDEIEAEAMIELTDDNEAGTFYTVAKNRLMNVNNWHHLAGPVSGSFQLFDAHCKEIARQPQKGDYIRIDIPGPGSKAGDGYDWVYVEELKEIAEGNIQSIGLRVRPSENPCGNTNDIAHFYSPEATSSFIVTRENKTVTARIVDRNIKPNTQPNSLTDKIRNTNVGIGAIGIFSKMQWQRLANGLVEKNDGK